jgi:hypothetical protein
VRLRAGIPRTRDKQAASDECRVQGEWGCGARDPGRGGLEVVRTRELDGGGAAFLWLWWRRRKDQVRSNRASREEEPALSTWALGFRSFGPAFRLFLYILVWACGANKHGRRGRGRELCFEFSRAAVRARKQTIIMHTTIQGYSISYTLINY